MNLRALIEWGIPQNKSHPMILRKKASITGKLLWNLQFPIKTVREWKKTLFDLFNRYDLWFRIFRHVTRTFTEIYENSSFCTLLYVFWQIWVYDPCTKVNKLYFPLCRCRVTCENWTRCENWFVSENLTPNPWELTSLIAKLIYKNWTRNSRDLTS